MSTQMKDLVAIPVMIRMTTLIIHSRYSSPNRRVANMRGFGQTYKYGNF